MTTAKPLPDRAKLEKPLPDDDRVRHEHEENNSWRFVAHANTEPSDYHLNPLPFEGLADRLRKFDRGTLIDPDGAWWAELLVIEQRRGFAQCLVLRSENFRHRDRLRVVVPGFGVRQANPGDGPGHSWMAVRVDDGACLNGATRLATEAEAEAYLRSSNLVHPVHQVASGQAHG